MKNPSKHLRTPRRFGLMLAGAALLAGLWCQDAPAQPVREIMEASIRAAGGYEALAGVEGLRREGDVQLTILGEVLEGKMELVVVPWRKAYHLIDVGIERLEQAWNGEMGWEDSYRRGRRKLDAKDAAAVRLQAVLHPLVGYQMLYTVGLPVEDAGEELIDDRAHHVLRVDFNEESKLRVYVDRETKLIGRLSLDAYAENLGVTFTINLDYDDYAEFGGIQLPQKTRLSIGHIFDLRTEYTRTEINPEIDESVFEYPIPNEE